MMENQSLNAIWFEGVLPCVSGRERPSQSRIVFLQRLPYHHRSPKPSHRASRMHLFCFLAERPRPLRSLPLSPYLNWMQVGNASLPHWNCDPAAWFRSHLFTLIYRYYFKEIEVKAARLAGSSARTQTSGVLKMESRGEGFRLPYFQSDIPNCRFCLTRIIIGEKGVKRSISLSSFNGAYMWPGPALFS